MNQKFKLLDESQNESFDAEYHSPGEINEKVARIRAHFPDGPGKILDIGGGNGRFLDEILSRFPQSSGFLIDISQTLLDRNSYSARKTLIRGSIENLKYLTGAEKFDIITINWVLHHLVGESRSLSIRNVIKTLMDSSDLLTPSGVIIVAENLLEGHVGKDAPSMIIFNITSQKNKLFAKLVRPFFNTAGVGVCFHSEAGWREIFRAANLEVVEEFKWKYWNKSLKKKILYPALLLKSERHGHFWLQVAK